jgi:thiol-disulfide isomerase/thioredoxin
MFRSKCRRSTFTLSPCVAALAIVALWSAGSPSTGAPKDGAPKDEAPKVEIQILDYDGIVKLIEGQKGKVVVVDCWSTSCAPCMKEFHNLVEMHKEHGAEKLACVSLCFDYAGIDKPEDLIPPALEFLKKEGASFDNLLSSDSDETLYAKFKMNSVPTVLVYGRDGKLAKKFDDNTKQANGKKGFSYAGVKTLVEELLAKPAE